MAVLIFLALLGAAFCVYRNSPLALRRYDLLLAGGTVAAAAAAYGAGWALLPQVLLSALFAGSLWLVAHQAEQRYCAQQQMRPSFESVQLMAPELPTPAPVPLRRPPVRQRLRQAPAGGMYRKAPDLALAEADARRYYERRF